MAIKSIYDFEIIDIDGKILPMSNFRNQVLLLVNTASKCGLTPQFSELEKLFLTYKNRSFTIIGFPCNQFQNQDPGTNEEIKSFCDLNYKVSFPMTSKIKVNGSDAHPLFKFLKEEAPGIAGSKIIKWNFTKFLVDRNGHVIRRFAPYHKPMRIIQDIEKLIQHQ